MFEMMGVVNLSRLLVRILPTAISKNIVHEYDMDAVYKTKYTINSRYLEFQGTH